MQQLDFSPTMPSVPPPNAIYNSKTPCLDYETSLLIMSSIQALIAVGVVLLFIMGLSKLKEFYAARKLQL